MSILQEHMLSSHMRHYQLDLEQAIFEAWQQGYKNVLAVSPTGSGKTVTFTDVVRIVSSFYKMPTVVMVHRKELVNQICDTLARSGIEHNIIAPREVVLMIMAEQQRKYKKSFYNYRSIVTVASVDTLKSRKEKYRDWALGQKVWVIDEAAHVLDDNKWGECVKLFPNALGLGVTATPQRLDRKGLGSHVDGVFDTMVIGPTVSYLIQAGYLADYRVIAPKSDYNKYLQQAQGDQDFTFKNRANASKKSHIVGDVAENYIKHAFGKQAIVFADSIDAGQRMIGEFATRGIHSVLLTGETDARERAKALNDFEQKLIPVLINVDLFDEGLDVPGIDVVILARPTMSVGKYLQMVGRGLRPVYANGYDLSTPEGRLAAQANGPKPYALIIDHVQNVKRHKRPCLVRRWTLDRIAKKRDYVNFMKNCLNPDCFSPYDRFMTECPYCGTVPEKASSGGGGMREALEVVDGDLELLDPKILREMEADSVLEDPVEVAKKVSHVAGPAAGRSMMIKQRERIETQKELVQAIAMWAGHRTKEGLTQRQMNKLFYISFGVTITMALGLARAEMEQIKEQVDNYEAYY